MPKGVIHLLEPIEVEEHRCELLGAVANIRKILLQPVCDGRCCGHPDKDCQRELIWHHRYLSQDRVVRTITRSSRVEELEMRILDLLRILRERNSDKTVGEILGLRRNLEG